MDGNICDVSAAILPAKGNDEVKLDLPSSFFGGNPDGLINHLGLVAQRRPEFAHSSWEVTARDLELVESHHLHGPPLTRSRLADASVPTPDIPGGMAPELIEQFGALQERLASARTLAALFELLVTTLIAVPDEQVPETLKWASETLSSIPITHEDGSVEELFPRHSIHDVRISEMVY